VCHLPRKSGRRRLSYARQHPPRAGEQVRSRHATMRPLQDSERAGPHR
jgi:hypothetical protein